MIYLTELRREIYSGWAFSKNENEKAKINSEIYEEIKDKAELKCMSTGYAHKKYKVVDNPENLSYKELALIADRGNLCFGYRVEGDRIVIHTD